MFSDLKIYFDLMAAERYWSWSAVGIIYLLTTLVVRYLVFSRVFSKTKQAAPNAFPLIKHTYLKNSLPGWILYALSFLLLMVVWVGWDRGVVRGGLWTLFSILLPSLFLLAIILHLIAFINSLLEVSRQKPSVERGF